MKKICAWCKKEISVSDIELDSQVTHGICEECENNLDFQFGVPLKVYLDALKLPVLVVTKEMKTIFANKVALKVIDKEMDAHSEDFSEEIFECESARLPGGCGKTTHCSGCVIRNIVTETFKTNKPIMDVPASLKSVYDDEPEEIDLLISTEMIENMVMLKIDKIQVKVC